MESYIVLWEFSKKQEYIFKSNRLKDNVGASIIMRSLSEDINKYGLDDNKFMVKGGGKNIYIFDSRDEGIEFIKNFSRYILKNYPGLEVFVVGREADLGNSSLKTEIDLLYKSLETKKRSRSNAGGQVAYGMEVMCRNTGMPASCKKDGDYISPEIAAKREIAKNNQKTSLEKLLPDGYNLVTGVDKLVQGEKSYIAIVHIDGNGMGKRFKELNDGLVIEKGETVESFNKRYFSTIREFSLGITKVYENAFKSMCDRVLENYDKLVEESKDGNKEGGKIEKGIFPIRPLILAGDDITYVCNGSIGIESARCFIEAVENQIIKVGDYTFGDFKACAGIAIVKKGYPFKRAYELAEELCGNAKKSVLDKGKDSSAIDFHISRGEIYGSLGDMIKGEYTSLEGNAKLRMRPLFLDESVSWKNYKNFCYSINDLERAVASKDIGRSKIKMLRDEFKKGPKATENFFKFYNISNKYFSYFEGLGGKYCFYESMDDTTCMYLDGIEAMEYFISLD